MELDLPKKMLLYPFWLKQTSYFNQKDLKLTFVTIKSSEKLVLRSWSMGILQLHVPLLTVRKNSNWTYSHINVVIFFVYLLYTVYFNCPIRSIRSQSCSMLKQYVCVGYGIRFEFGGCSCWCWLAWLARGVIQGEITWIPSLLSE